VRFHFCLLFEVFIVPFDIVVLMDQEKRNWGLSMVTPSLTEEAEVQTDILIANRIVPPDTIDIRGKFRISHYQQYFL